MNLASFVMALAGWFLLVLVVAGVLLGCVLTLSVRPGSRRGGRMPPRSVAAAGVWLAILVPTGSVSMVARDVFTMTPSVMAREDTGLAEEVLVAGGTLVGTGYDRLGPLLSAFVLVWIAGAAIGIIRLIGAVRAHDRVIALCRSRAMNARDSRVERIVGRLAGRLGLPVAPRVAVATVAKSPGPLVIGWREPLLLIAPHTLHALDGDELESVLLHELAHVRNRDYARNLALEALTWLLWPSVAVWLGVRLLRQWRETDCDDAAVSAGADAHVLARALVSLEEHRQRGAGLAMAASGSSLVARVCRLLQPDVAERSPRAVLALSFVLAVALLPLSAMAGRESSRIAAAAAHARPLAGHTMQVTATDPAGSFTLEIANGTLVGATVDGVPAPRHRLEQRGDTLRVLARGSVLIGVTMTAGGGIEWEPRVSR